jgi:type III secretion protein T
MRSVVITEISREINALMVALLVSLPRIYAFLSAAQLLPSSVIPGMPRTAAIVGLAFMAVPINLEYAETLDRRAILTFIAYFAKEYVIGFLLGYLIGWMFWVVQAVGGLIDNQRGTAIASAVDPLQGQESSTLGLFMSQAFLTYVFAAGAFLPILGVLYKSFVIWPAAKAVPLISDAFPTMALALFDNAMRIAFVLAAPIVVVMFMAEFSLALISRFSPQVQVFVLAMPIKSMIAIIMLIFYFSTFMPFAEKQLNGSRAYVEQLYQFLNFGDTIRTPTPTPPPTPPRPPARGPN